MQPGTSQKFFFLVVWSACHLYTTGANTICFVKYGCFSTTKPLQSKHATLPDHPSVIQTKFYLHTRKNPRVAEILDVDDLSSIANSHFNPLSRTVIIIHGYSHHSNKPWVLKMRKELLKRKSFNVISVDWQKGAAFALFYMKAVANARLVGAQTAHLIEILKMATRVSPLSFHIVGHSLGAHIAGYAGRKLATKNMFLGRITGLDPARLEYEDAHTALRLDKTDAKFVDVIHSNAAPFIFGGVGYRGRLGHVDFYPNGGEYQPGCESLFKTIWHKGIYNAATCNHLRSVEFFTISIGGKCPFIAFPCSSWQAFEKGRCFENNPNDLVSRMGYDAEKFKDRIGSMYLKTLPTYPYCVYNYVVTVNFKKSRNKYNALHVKIIGTQDETKNEKIKLPEGKGNKIHLFTSNRDIGEVTRIEILYYGFDSFYIGHIQVNIIHKKQIYTACFDQKITNDFWAFWKLSWTKHKRKVIAGKDCASQS